MNDHIIEVIARAIITDETGTKMLFCALRDTEPPYFYLPGGHIEFGEMAKVALVRELYEETGVDASEAEFNFAGTDERIFTQGNNPHHEINVYFEVRGVFSGNEEIPSMEEEISFRWLALADISNLPVLPEGIKNFLSQWKKGKQIQWENE